MPTDSKISLLPSVALSLKISKSRACHTPGRRAARGRRYARCGVRQGRVATSVEEGGDIIIAISTSSGRRCCMMELQKEDMLEEMWRIKREIAAEYPTWDAYVAGILAFQEEVRRRGVKFVSFPPKRPEQTMEHCQ